MFRHNFELHNAPNDYKKRQTHLVRFFVHLELDSEIELQLLH